MRAIGLTSASLLAIFAASDACAQQAADAATTPAATATQATTDTATTPPGDQGDIIVTAQKRSERLQDVPKSVDVVQGDTIQKLNLTSFAQIDQLAPGLTLNAKEPTTNAVTLRGVGFDPNSGAAPTVDIYFNETAIDSSSAFRALYDVGQIEVLRGPQGTLRGRTSPSGAITIATRRPNLNRVDGYFQQSLTTQAGINSQGAVSAPIVPGVLAVRVAGLFDRNNGINVSNLRNGSKDRDKTESVRGSIAFRPTSNLDFDLTYQYLNNRTVKNSLLFTLPGEVTNPILRPSDRSALSTTPGMYDYRGHIVTLAASLDLGGAAVNYIGGYQNIKQGRALDTALGGTIPDFSQQQVFNSRNEQISQEVRLTSQGPRFWNYLFGAYYERGTGRTLLTQDQFLPFGFVTPNATPLPISQLNVGVDIPGKSDTYAAFTDHRFKVTGRDELQVGLRYQETHVRTNFILSLDGPVLGPDPIISSGVSPANQDRTFRQLTGGASFRHEFNRDLTGYVTYGRSYRPGSLNTTTASLDESLLVTRPETSDNYEVGLKGAFADRRVQFTVALYQQDFKNYLAYTNSFLTVASTKPGGVKDGVVDNNVAFGFNADARVRGIEATLSTRIGNALQVGLSGTYNDAKFRNGLAPCNDFNGDGSPDSDGTPFVPVGQNVSFCRQNGRLSDQAPWGVSVNAEYRVPVSGDREVFVRGLANYVPKRSDPFTAVDYDDLLNNSLFLGVRGPDDRYEFSVFAKNLANVSTVTFRGAQQIDYSLFSTGYASGNVTQPREIGLNFRVSY